MNEIEVKLNTSSLSAGSIIVLENLNSYIVTEQYLKTGINLYDPVTQFNAVNLATGTKLFDDDIESLELFENELKSIFKNKYDDVKYCVINNAKIGISG